MNTDKIYAEQIANEYAPRETSKVIALRKLDARAKLPAMVFTYSMGILSALVFGVGMCLAMGQIGSGTVGSFAAGIIIGIVGLMIKDRHCAVLKKFFVKKEFRSQKVGLALYNELLSYAKNNGVRHILLDTPSVAHASHRFYEKAGFRKIGKEELPVPYSYAVLSVFAQQTESSRYHLYLYT